MVKLIYDNTKNADLFYKVRANIHDSFFYLEIEEQAIIFLDYREIGAFNEINKNPNIKAQLLNPLLEEAGKINSREKTIFKLAELLLSKYKLLTQEIFVPVSFPLDLADYLRSSGIVLIPLEPFYAERVVKTEQEIKFIKDNLNQTFSAYQHIEQVLRDSVIEGDKIIYQKNILTSELLKKEVEKVLLSSDLLLTDGIIISSGLQSAMPHHSGQGPLLASQPIICDIFPRSRVNGYYADMTRTYFKGQPSPKLFKMYQTVLLAQEIAIKSIKPGLIAGAVHQQCVDTFLAAGYAVGNEGFVHGTGHGLGLQIHESPYLNAVSLDVLSAGNVFSVEPGLYYSELGGIRIEDIVLVTPTGYENLTNYPKDIKIF